MAFYLAVLNSDGKVADRGSPLSLCSQDALGHHTFMLIWAFFSSSRAIVRGELAEAAIINACIAQGMRAISQPLPKSIHQEVSSGSSDALC